jgi:hypothetical protein
MKPQLILLLLSLTLYQCSRHDDRPARFRRAYKLAHAGQLEKANDALDSMDLVSPGVPDSASLLSEDLKSIFDKESIQNLALEIDAAKQWDKLEQGAYLTESLGLHSSLELAKPYLLKIKPQIPSLNHIARQKEKQQEASRKKSEKERLAAEKREPITKREAAAAGLRELYLDNRQDVKISLSGKDKTIITLSYILIGDVWEHEMNKAGNIDALLDLGFKKVILTNGYDYRKVWSRKD